MQTTEKSIAEFIDNCYHYIESGKCTPENLQKILKMEGSITEKQMSRYSKMLTGGYTFLELIAEYLD